MIKHTEGSHGLRHVESELDNVLGVCGTYWCYFAKRKLMHLFDELVEDLAQRQRVNVPWW